MNKINVGVVGCGNISGIYFKNLKRFPFLNVAACADLDVSRAKAKAAEHGIARACSADELLGDADIDVVVNLTIPKAHASVAMAAVKAGKSAGYEAGKDLWLAMDVASSEFFKDGKYVMEGEGKKGKEWKVTFKDPAAKDKTKETLYMFFTQPGNFIAANFTGQ